MGLAASSRPGCFKRPWPAGSLAGSLAWLPGRLLGWVAALPVLVASSGGARAPSPLGVYTRFLKILNFWATFRF